MWTLPRSCVAWRRESCVSASKGGAKNKIVGSREKGGVRRFSSVTRHSLHTARPFGRTGATLRCTPPSTIRGLGATRRKRAQERITHGVHLVVPGSTPRPFSACRVRGLGAGVRTGVDRRRGLACGVLPARGSPRGALSLRRGRALYWCGGVLHRAHIRCERPMCIVGWSTKRRRGGCRRLRGVDSARGRRGNWRGARFRRSCPDSPRCRCLNWRRLRCRWLARRCLWCRRHGLGCRRRCLWCRRRHIDDGRLRGLCGGSSDDIRHGHRLDWRHGDR